MKLTNDTAAAEVDRFISTIPASPRDGEFSGRGIVCCAGGQRYLLNAYVMIRMLRSLGCSLPVQIWHLGEGELIDSLVNKLLPLGVVFYDARAIAQNIQPRHTRLHGWEVKPFAVLNSSFAEVLLLDADNVPVVDPAFLFEIPEYRETGAVFWPDFNRLKQNRLAWRVFGNIEYRDEPEFESGQLLIDKRRPDCWRALVLTDWYNRHSDFFFDHAHGDKETFHLAWRKLGVPYSMPSKGIHALPGVMCQHDFQGRRIFQHRNMEKWAIVGNKRIPGFLHEAKCLSFVAEARNTMRVRDQWKQMSPSDAETAARLAGVEWEYCRIGFDQRLLSLSNDGTIGHGAARCEVFWHVENGDVVICDDHGNVTCRLKEDARGVLAGQWDQHERMAVRMIPLPPIKQGVA